MCVLQAQFITCPCVDSVTSAVREAAKLVTRFKESYRNQMVLTRKRNEISTREYRSVGCLHLNQDTCRYEHVIIRWLNLRVGLHDSIKDARPI